ncbi:MAG: DNA polymerase III subunit gamma/tau [Candidatus Saccharimonadales bacterium]
MSQALYRKYRSRGFEEVVGQQHVTDLLAGAIKSGNISHAYLFTGPRGTGKTSVARIVAHAINGLPYADDSSHLDIIEIDAASNRRIDDIRDLREKVYIAPTTAKYKVYIIDEVHMLTGESFNALLKTLEEPPAHAVFILATTELHKVPATIVSRTQRFHFRPGSVEAVSMHLRHIADQESIDISDEALRLIAEHSEGGFRDSVSLLDQVSSIGEGTITIDTVESLVGLAPHSQVEQIVDEIVRGNNLGAVSQISALMSDGMSPPTIIAQLTKSLSSRAATHPRLYDLIYELVEIPKSYVPEMKLLAVVGKEREEGREKREEDHKEAKQARSVVRTQAETKPPLENNTSQAKKLEPTTASPGQEPAERVIMPDTKPVADSPVSPEPTTTASIDWSAVLAETLKRAPALHSILKRADVVVTPESITLTFGFKLHRTKMNDEKQRRELVAIITNLYGSCPEIVIAADGGKLDATAAAVADIMGGGEAVTI